MILLFGSLAQLRLAGWWLLIICFSKTASGVYSSQEQTVRQGMKGGADDDAKDNDKPRELL